MSVSEVVPRNDLRGTPSLCCPQICKIDIIICNSGNPGFVLTSKFASEKEEIYFVGSIGHICSI